MGDGDERCRRQGMRQMQEKKSSSRALLISLCKQTSQHPIRGSCNYTEGEMRMEEARHGETARDGGRAGRGGRAGGGRRDAAVG